MQERVYKTQAVVLRRTDYGEADLLLTLYTPQHGKVRAMAKGARKPIGRKTGQLELYTQAYLVIRRGREMQQITQAETQEPFIAIQNDLDRSIYASHFTELIDQFTYEDEENELAYDLLVTGLNWLCAEAVNLRLVARYYEYLTLRVMGFAPTLFECAISGDDLPPEDHYFSLVEGGVVSNAHANTHNSQLIHLPLRVFKILRYFSRQPWQTVQNLQLSDSDATALERILHLYLTYILERRLQSANFLRKLQRDLS